MTYPSDTVLTGETDSLNSRISEMENLYAELFLDSGNPELLKNIHLQLEALKCELEQVKR